MGRSLCVHVCLTLALVMLSGLPAQAKATCIRLKRVHVRDLGLLDRQARNTLFLDQQGQCISPSLLESIVSTLASELARRGFVTSLPYLKPQPVANGVVTVDVLKGTIGAIVNQQTDRPDGRIRFAFAFLRGNALNLRDLETALEMMNRPPSSHASFAIKPGNQPGASIIEVNERDTMPWHLQLGLTGRRQAGQDEGFVTAEVSLDNPLNINDILAFRLNGEALQRRHQSTRAGEIDYSFPVSSYLLEFIASRSFYRQGIQGISDTFLAEGNTTGFRTKISKVLTRNRTNKLTLAASVAHNINKNFLANQLIQASSYKTTVAQLDVTHLWLWRRGSLTTSYSYERGTDWFGARKDGFFGAQTGAPGQARLQFVKHELDMSLNAGLPVGGIRLSARAHLQRTLDALFDNDKLSVGGDYTVRGYPDGSLYGNNAWYVRSELVRSWPVNLNASALQSVSLFGGYDYGHVRCETDNPLSCGNVYGVVAGLRTQGTHANAAFTAAWPLKKVSASFKRRPTLRLDMTWGF